MCDCRWKITRAQEESRLIVRLHDSGSEAIGHHCPCPSRDQDVAGGAPPTVVGDVQLDTWPACVEVRLAAPSSQSH